MEIKGNTTKLLYTLQSRRSLFAGKAVFGVLEEMCIRDRCDPAALCQWAFAELRHQLPEQRPCPEVFRCV